MEEIYKNIPGYEGIYQVSNLGNVKSLERKVANGFDAIRVVKERILKHRINNRGYYVVGVHKEGKVKTMQIHQLIAIAFLGHKPDGYKIVVDHIDNNPLNNALNNLRLITHRTNVSKDRVNGSSKYTGVCWHKHNNKWMSKIQIDGKIKYLGYFTEELDAHKAYQNELNLKNYGTK